MANTFTLKKGQSVTAKIGDVEVIIQCDCDDDPGPAQRGIDLTHGLQVDGTGVTFLMPHKLAASLELARRLRDADAIHEVPGSQVEVLLPQDLVFDLENPGLRAVLSADVDVDISVPAPRSL